MKYFNIFLFLVSIIFTSCMPPPLELRLDSNVPFIRSDWEKYDAVYEYNELHVDTYLDEDTWQFKTTFTVNQKIHILTQEGVYYGTIILPEYGEKLSYLKVKLFDTDNKEVEIDIDRIKRKYEETKKIVVPNVQKGFKIQMSIKMLDFDPFVDFEYWFKERIPVIRGRFTLSTKGDFQYKYKTYGGVQTSHESSTFEKNYFIWDVENLYPDDDIVGYKWIYDDAPRTLVILSKFDIYYSSPDWKLLSKRYQRYVIPESLLQQKYKIRKEIISLIQNTSTENEKAQKILSYIYDNYSFNSSDSRSINLTSVFKNKTGNILEITVLLSEMMKYAGIKNKILVTRSHNDGGFDPDFPSWHLVGFPLVEIEIDSRKNIVYPFWKGSQIGEYPCEYFDLKALSLNDGEIVDLPAPKYKVLSTQSQVFLDLKHPDQEQKWIFKFKEYYAYVMRKSIYNESDVYIKKKFQKRISKFGKANIVNSVKLVTKNKDLVSAKINFNNKDFSIKRKDKIHYSLSPFVRLFFTDYIPSRTINYRNDVERNYKEIIIIPKENENIRKIDFKCQDIDTELFCSKCTIKKRKDEIHLIRKIKIKIANLTPEQMKDIHPDIQKLNMIKSSSIIDLEKNKQYSHKD